MLAAAVGLGALNLIFLVLLLLRRVPVPPVDPRLIELAQQLPAQIARLDARAESTEAHVRMALEALRREQGMEAATTREANANAFAALRTEIAASITTLGTALNTGLDGFRGDNKTSAEALRGAVQQSLDTLTQRLASFAAESSRGQMEAREALHARLQDLAAGNAQHQEKLRASVEQSLSALNRDNAEKLEQMRATVDEKLQSTLHERLTSSFGAVTDQLNKVHAGLGEMSKLSEGVDGLSRIFTNVKSRGGFAEVQLGMLLRQMLAPGQYLENAQVRENSLERVEFAVRFPASAGERLMPIDAKFPREDWERLEAAYGSNRPEEIAREGKAFENALRTQAEKICAKYINPPKTTPYAIMFLPTEGLYAEVIRRDALQAEIQSKCHVTIAGPTTLSAILTSFQMGFHMLALQEKGDEVWKVLESAKGEFGKFGKLMDKVEGDVTKIQKTIGEVGVRTRAINRTLREVSDPGTPARSLLEFEDFATPALSLAASVEEE
jgi:DNA recombination protein RmuC